MENNLLFIYHDIAVIDEFCETMMQFDFTIDTADNGLDVVELLKENEYKVVVTGMNLTFFDGLKIIEFLNHNYPKTVCIAYTSRMDLARLKFLVNQREVFRIFLRPVNYHGDFYQAIKEGFEYYDLLAVKQEEEDRTRKKHLEYQAAVEQLQRLTSHKKENTRILAQFLVPLIKWSVNRYSPHLSQPQREQVIKFEEKILFYFLRGNYHLCKSLDEMQHFLEEEFHKEEEGRSLLFDLKPLSGPRETLFYEENRFILWLLLERYMILSKSYAASISLSEKNAAVLSVAFTLPDQTMERHDEHPLSVVLTELTKQIISAIAMELKSSIDGDAVRYTIRIDPAKENQFMDEKLTFDSEIIS